MPNGKAIKSYSEYKKLTKDQKELWQFEKLLKIDVLYHKVDDLPTKFAAKWTEKAMMGFISLILLAVVGAMVTGVLN